MFETEFRDRTSTKCYPQDGGSTVSYKWIGWMGLDWSLKIEEKLHSKLYPVSILTAEEMWKVGKVMVASNFWWVGSCRYALQWCDAQGFAAHALLSWESHEWIGSGYHCKIIPEFHKIPEKYYVRLNWAPGT